MAKSKAKKNKTGHKNKPAKNKSANANQKSTGKNTQDKPRLSRRNLLLLLGATPVALAGGYKIHQYDTTKKVLHDLSIIGEGQPVVLQVHDPSCQLCQRLKRTTESVLEDLPDIQYRIADLTTNEGREFAQRYNVGKVTLLLFNETGKHVHTVQGVTPKEELISQFEQYL